MYGKTNAGAFTGGIEMVKLWENASPSSNFGQQFIELDLSGYNFVIIGMLNNATADPAANDGAYMILEVNGHGGKIFIETSAKIVQRGAWAKSDGIDMRDGLIMNTYAAPDSRAANSFYLIPYRIYGIKGGH